MFVTVIMVSCDDELDDELFEQYTYLKDNGWVELELEIQDDNTVLCPYYISVNGTSGNKSDIKVTLAADPDTLSAYNLDRFKTQTHLYYKELPEDYYSFDKTEYLIPAGEIKAKAVATIDLSKFASLYEQYVLPIRIASSDGMPTGQSKYSKSLFFVSFINKFSGVYNGAGTLKMKVGNTEYSDNVPGITLFGMSTNTCYFYAGNVTRTNNLKYDKYVVDAVMDESGIISLSSKNADLNIETLSTNLERTYRKHNTDSRYYIETATLEFRYSYDGQEEYDSDARYTYEGKLSKIKNVLKEDYPNVTLEEQ